MAEINEILAKNLEFIKTYDSELCDKLSTINTLTSNIQMVYTHLNEANLAIDGIAINEQSGAEKEAERIVSTLPHNLRNSIHVVLGMGFGYIFSKTVEVSNGSVILYEPNIELLRVALEMVDMSEFLSKKKVFVTNDIKMLEKHFLSCFSINSRCAVLACAYYKVQGLDKLNTLVKKLSLLQGLCQSNEMQRHKYGYSYAQAVCENLFDLKDCYPIEILKDKFKDKPAIIAAAGPSLNENIDLIKENRNKFLLFGVSSSFSSLIKNEIYPDFVSIVEKFDAVGMFKNLPLDTVSLIAEPYINNSVLNLPFKNKFITSSIENSANNIYSSFINVEREYFETKGTVAYNALYSAMFLGCNPIILVGQDLAYIDGECYSKKSPLHPIQCKKTENGWEVLVTDIDLLKSNLFGHKDVDDEIVSKQIHQRIEFLNRQLVIGHTKYGEEVPSSLTFSMFSEYYKSFAQRFSKKLRLYNTTKKGLDIGDFEYCSLENLLLSNGFDSFNFNLDDITFDKKININFLDKEISVISSICADMEKIRPMFGNLRHLIEQGELTEKIIKDIKLALHYYVDLTEKGNKKSVIYPEIMLESSSGMSLVFDWLNTLSLDVIMRLWFNLRVFYAKDYERLVNALNILKKTREKIENEVSASKS